MNDVQWTEYTEYDYDDDDDEEEVLNWRGEWISTHQLN